MSTFTPAQKAARTRFDNKAWARVEAASAETQKIYGDLIDSLCPERNLIIDKIEAERDALISEITQKYQVQIDSVMDKYSKIFDPVNEKKNQQFSAAYAIYKKEMADFDEKQALEVR